MLFAVLFPDDCRLCGSPLTEVSRVPVCAACLEPPEPLESEHFCLHCRTPFSSSHALDEEGRCGLCRLGLNGFDAAYSFGPYEGRLRELVPLFKYGGVETLAGPLGSMALPAFPRGERFDVIVPMPMHWLRRWRRGFNQAELLAREIGRRTGLPIENPIRRRRATNPQANLSGSQRRANVAGAFRMKRRASIRGRRVLLVDDVFTTGASASACAATLKRAGAQYVAVFALARTDRRHAANDLKAIDETDPLTVGATECM